MVNISPVLFMNQLKTPLGSDRTMIPLQVIALHNKYVWISLELILTQYFLKDQQCLL